jgi:hypothetical protein
MKKVKSKSAKPVLDISKLPDKYFYDNQEKNQAYLKNWKRI